MKEKGEQESGDGRTPFERFADLARRVVSVPKEEIDKRERKWRASRKASRKKK